MRLPRRPKLKHLKSRVKSAGDRRNLMLVVILLLILVALVGGKNGGLLVRGILGLVFGAMLLMAGCAIV
jgi:hypothetical protein